MECRCRHTEDGMAKNRSTHASAQAKTVTPERAARLYRLIKTLKQKPQTRDYLRRRLRLDLRGFYRDLELLREAGIDLPLINRRYVLPERANHVLIRLPFPDPRLTLGEAIQLAKGRSKAHKKLKQIIDQIEK
jgi:hypothetical protein